MKTGPSTPGPVCTEKGKCFFGESYAPLPLNVFRVRSNFSSFCLQFPQVGSKARLRNPAAVAFSSLHSHPEAELCVLSGEVESTALSEVMPPWLRYPSKRRAELAHLATDVAVLGLQGCASNSGESLKLPGANRIGIKRLSV